MTDQCRPTKLMTSSIVKSRHALDVAVTERRITQQTRASGRPSASFNGLMKGVDCGVTRGQRGTGVPHSLAAHECRLSSGQAKHADASAPHRIMISPDGRDAQRLLTPFNGASAVPVPSRRVP